MKKNQFALIFLTLVVMLAVWYIKSPLNKDKDTGQPIDDGTVLTSSRVEAFKNMRDSLNNERSEMVATYDVIIASSDTSVNEKEQALHNKNAISNLTEKEILLEVQIMNLGYTDAFVHANNDEVEVIVVADASDNTIALEIIQNVLVSFD